jgi:uridine kinase
VKNYPKNEKICYKQGFLSVDESFVKACDREFDLRLGEAVANLGADKSVRVIGLTGPTCSGKTTAAKKLISYLGDEQRRVCTVSLDDFFKDQFSREKLVGADPEKLDFDSPDTLDTDALSLFIDDLFTKGIAKKPVFDFVRGIRSNWETTELDGDDVLLLEGIQVLYPAVMSIIESHGGSVLCVRPESGIEVDGKFFDPDFIRLCRRLVRDSNFRGASPEFTMGLWEGVRRNEDENIFPFIDACSIRIDTTLPYELNILAPYLRKLLSKMKKDDKHYKKGMDILDMFCTIEEMDSIAVAENSLYREFV